MNKVLAQVVNLPGGEKIEGPLNKPGMPQFNTLADLVNNAIPYIYAIAGILLILYLIWGGYDYLLSMGDPKKTEAGRNKITTAIIGILIIFVSYWVIQLADYLLQLNYF